MLCNFQFELKKVLYMILFLTSGNSVPIIFLTWFELSVCLDAHEAVNFYLYISFKFHSLLPT
jgi:hypothetical protein